VTAASVDDAKAAAELFGRRDGQPMGKVTRVFADGKCHNSALYEWVETNARWDLVIVRRPDGSKGWVKLPRRWTVERSNRSRPVGFALTWACSGGHWRA